MQTKKRKNSEKQKIRGFLFALFGGILWGFSGTCGQYLFTFEDLEKVLKKAIEMVKEI